MKLISGVVRPDKVDDIKAALEQVQVLGMTVTEVRDHCLNVWSAGIVGLIHAYDPSVVVLGGGVMASADQIIPAVSSYIERHALTWWGKPGGRPRQHC